MINSVVDLTRRRRRGHRVQDMTPWNGFSSGLALSSLVSKFCMRGRHRNIALDLTILAHLFHVLVLSTEFVRKGRIRSSLLYSLCSRRTYNHSGHYLYVLGGFPDDLKEALQKMDNLAMEEHMMIAAQTLVVVEQLPSRVKRSEQCPVQLSRGS